MFEDSNMPFRPLPFSGLPRSNVNLYTLFHYIDFPFLHYNILSLRGHRHIMTYSTFSILQLTIEAIDHNPEVDAECWKNGVVEYVEITSSRF